MAESQIAQKVQELLNEEKWTRASLGAYSAANLKELDVIAQDALKEKVVDEVKALCDEHLAHTKTSIIALYLSGIFALIRQQIDDSAMVSLLDIFADNKKWSVVEFVCQRILDYGENRMALRRLADCYEADGRAEDMYAVWERLVRVDYEEADIVKALAEKREKESKADEAVDYYKKALQRYINKGLTTNVKEIWAKLVEYCPEDIDFFFYVQRKIAKQISEDKAAGLLLDLYRHYKDKEDWNTGLDILKVVIDYDEKNPSLRKDVIECYRGKYKDHSHIEDYIRLSNIAQSYRAIHEAMADFEKHIAFDAGNFVYHRTWNIGRIASITGDEIVIDFAKSRGHKMSLKMAIDSLTTLSKEHIWVLKAVWSKDKLREKVKSDPAWALRIIIKSFDNRADLKHIKSELVPSVLTPSEWNSWSGKAREALKTDSNFGNAADDIAHLHRARPAALLRGEGVQPVQGREELLRPRPVPARLPRVGRARLGVLHGDARLFHGLRALLPAGQRDRRRILPLPQGARGKVRAPQGSRHPRLRRALRADRGPCRRLRRHQGLRAPPGLPPPRQELRPRLGRCLRPALPLLP